MKIPKKIENMLNKKEKLAMKLISVSSELDKWLESKGVDLTDTDINDAVLSGCMIYAEPWTAKRIVQEYIENKL